jgi:SAM-dependent methyltransferase
MSGRSSLFGNAEAYDRFMGRWSRVLAPLLIEFADVSDVQTVLDVGSGTGSLAFSIAKQNVRSHVLGVDPSNEYVAYANSKNPFPDRVSFQIGDAQRLPFADAPFQSSISLLAFNFIPDPQKALREMRRATKPGGRISAAVWDYGSGMRMLRVFWDAAIGVDATAENLDERHMPLCRDGELAQLWKQAGLENVHGQPLEITMRFESFEDYWDPFLMGQGPAGAYVRNLDGERREALRREVKHRLALTADDASLMLPARAWAVYGTVPIQ